MRQPVCKLLLIGASCLFPAAMRAQASPGASSHEIDLAITYSSQRDRLTSGSSFWRQGGAVELSAEITHGLGAAMNISGSRATNISGSGVNLTTITATFGPRYTWRPRSGKIALFGQGLLGESHGLDGLFPSVQGAQTDFNTFALQVGGGIDIPMKHHLAVRPLQADWVRTQFPNGATNVQNDLRLSGGIVLRLQR